MNRSVNVSASLMRTYSGRDVWSPATRRTASCSWEASLPFLQASEGMRLPKLRYNVIVDGTATLIR